MEQCLNNLSKLGKPFKYIGISDKMNVVDLKCEASGETCVPIICYSDLCNHAEERSWATILQHLFLWQCDWWYGRHSLLFVCFFLTKSFSFHLLNCLSFAVGCGSSHCLLRRCHNFYFWTHCPAVAFFSYRKQCSSMGKQVNVLHCQCFWTGSLKGHHFLNHTGDALINFKSI